VPSDSKEEKEALHAELLNCSIVAVTAVLTHALTQSPHFLAPTDSDTMAACLLSRFISLVKFACINAFREVTNPSQAETVIQSKRLIHCSYIVQ